MTSVQSPFRLILVIFLSVFVSELLVMFFLSLLRDYSMWKWAVIDSTLLTLLLIPILYYYAFKPIVHQINERKEAENALLRVSNQNKLILDAAGEGIFGLDSEGRVVFANPSAAAMLGYSVEELIGEVHHHKVHHSKSDGAGYPHEDCPINAAYRDGTVHHGTEEVFWKKDGTSIPIEYISTPIMEKGELKGAVVTFKDITERKRMQAELDERVCQVEFLWTAEKKAEDALRESEKRYRTLFRDSRDAIFITTKEGRFIDFNHSAQDLFGYTRQEMIRLNVENLYATPDEREKFHRDIEQTGSLRDYEVKLRKKDGTVIDCLLTASLRLDDEGNIVGYHGIIHDITDRKKLEQQLLQSQKMEAVGQLAGGVAHDFNNILTAIIGFGNLLKMDLDKDDPLNYYVAQILNSAERAANLTRALLAFSRKQIISPRPVNINEVIRGVEKLLSRIISEDVELSISLTNKDLVVMADIGQIEQVLMNLSANARDAMPNGGRLMVSTELVEMDEDFIKAHGFSKGGDHALITIEDTGEGMDKNTRERIFEPFFTTKEVGQGTGLGLSMVYGIIKQHNGHIQVYSEPGKGTIFNIYLPLVQSKVNGIKTDKPHVIKQGTETLLIVEDDYQIRDLLKRLLEGFGYKVIEAVDGEDAIKVFNENKEKIQLLILDVIMPKKDGKQVYNEIKRIKPDIRAIFSSGYKTDIVQRKGIVEEGLDFIFKPISPNELLVKVREVLDK